MEDEREACFSTLKFPFLPLPAPTILSPEHPSGMATPPLQTLASVPFKWEELPGKPRPCTDIVVRPESAKCLELPPAHRITKMSSPTTVLDGPYNVARPKFSSFRLFREARGSFDSSSSSGGGSPHSSVEILLGKKKKKKTTTFFGKLRSGRKGVVGGSFGFSPFSAGCDGFEKCSRVKMEGKKLRRNGSFSSWSGAPSTHLWVTVRESIKKAIPWKS
ncbi:hypothetical protein ACS0TY_002334 [Phlomoides rotata]